MHHSSFETFFLSSGFWNHIFFIYCIQYFAKFSCKIEHVSRVSLFFDQSQTPSAGPPSGNASSGTTRICDANAPEGKSVIFAIVR